MREIDTSELDALAAEFAAAPARVRAAIVPVANKAGVNMKRTMRKDASGHGHLPRLPATIEYETTAGPSSVSVDVGWLRPSGQGHLENIAVFGTANNAPVMDITRPLADEVPNFMRWVARVGAEVL